VPLLGRGGGLATFVELELLLLLLALLLLLLEALLDLGLGAGALVVVLETETFSGTAGHVVAPEADGGSSTFFSVDGGLLNESLTLFSEAFCATLSLRLWMRNLEAAWVSFRTS